MSSAPVVLEKLPGRPRGRHSRDEDLEDTGPVPGAELRSADARAAAQDERPTQRIALDDLLTAGSRPRPTAEPTVEPTQEAQEKQQQAQREKAQRAPRGSQSTAADVALIRAHPEVRNRILGAVLAPFVVYAAVMLVIGAHAVHYLLWIWIPMVSAGVLAGLVLDAAHRRAPPEETDDTAAADD